MIIVLKNANFANNNIGEVDIPRVISTFTRNAIAASGNTFTDAQVEALDVFFDTIGAFTNSGIWAKMEKVWLPMLAGGLAKACVNYKGNAVEATPSDYYTIRNHGITRSEDGASTDKISFTAAWNWNGKGVYLFPTETLPAGGSNCGVIGSNNVTSGAWRALRLNISSGGASSIQACVKGTTTYLTSVFNGTDDATQPKLLGCSLISGNTVAVYSTGSDTHATTLNSAARAYLTDDECTIYPFAQATSGALNKGTTATGAFFWGNALTSAEAQVLGAAMQALWNAINV